MYYTLLKRQALTCIYAHYLIYFPAGPLSKELAEKGLCNSSREKHC